MNAFDKVVGYESIKNELLQICDMIHNRETYEKLGARLPQGVLLYGAPGLGKTLIAKSFIEESGLKAYILRRDKGDDFVGSITETFREAKENSPCIIFLDDMDKFANEDKNHCDAKEYVAVQAGIDEVKGHNVFILATVNKLQKLPDSLVRSGRFDRRIEVECPNDKDAAKIVRHYLSGKKMADDIDMDDLSKMISYSSCAELETILNEAAINAAYARKNVIETEDLIGAVLKMQYGSRDNSVKKSQEDIRKIALHEAGHLVVSEAISPGSVGIASLRSTGKGASGGFIHHCRELPGMRRHVLVALAGKAAVELYYADTCAGGCRGDIERAFTYIRDGLSESGILGVGMIDVATQRFPHTSENMNSRSEAVTHAVLERYMLKARDILLKNKDFLEKTAAALIKKETLLHSDIRKIRENTVVTEVAV